MTIMITRTIVTKNRENNIEKEFHATYFIFKSEVPLNLSYVRPGSEADSVLIYNKFSYEGQLR